MCMHIYIYIYKLYAHMCIHLLLVTWLPSSDQTWLAGNFQLLKPAKWWIQATEILTFRRQKLQSNMAISRFFHGVRCFAHLNM